MSTNKMKFNLQNVRKSKGLSQTDLAKACDLTTSAIQNYERGTKKQYSHELLERFCQVLQCQPGELFIMVDEDKQVPALNR